MIDENFERNNNNILFYDIYKDKQVIYNIITSISNEFVIKPNIAYTIPLDIIFKHFMEKLCH